MKYIVDGHEFNVNKVLNRIDHKNLILDEYKELENGLIIKDGGMTIYTKTGSNIELSKGCQACKSGTWWCLFVGNNCNTECAFCPKTKAPGELSREDHPRSIVNYWIDDVIFYLNQFGSKLSGVSYSGGEPLLYLDKIIKIAECIDNTQKHIYQWIYTNGLLINEDVLIKLKSVGINEVRVNLAATDFNDKIVEKLKMVKEIIGKVTIEVPSIREVFKKLIDEEYIYRLEEYGVEQINLAELTLDQPLNWETYAINEDVYEYDTSNWILHSPVQSRVNVAKIIQYSLKNNINVLINDCSNDSKHLHEIMREQNSPLIMR